MRIRVRLIVAAGLMGIVGSQVRGATPSFQGLGDLPGGDDNSAAHGVSADGSVVVGMSKSSNGQEAFRWANGAMVGLGTLPADTFLSVAWAIAADGSAIVGASSANGPRIEAFRWANGAMVGLGDLPEGTFFSVAQAASADGSVVVGLGTHGAAVWDNEGLLWSNGAMTRLGDLPGGSYYSTAQGISADGSVVVGYSDAANGYEAFRWVNGGMAGLGDLPGGDFHSTAESISADASVIVGGSKSGNGYEAFRWANGAMVGLGDLPGGDFYSTAQDVSADGSVVVGYSKSGNGKEAFLWTANFGMRNLRDMLVNDYGLDLTGWTLTQAVDVSGDGMTIVGQGKNANGNAEGWIARIGFTLTVKINNQACGTLRVEPDLPKYLLGTVVTLTATPGPDCRVKSWSGADDDTSVARANTATMSANKTVTLEFEAVPPPMGTLSIDTNPVRGEVFVNGESWGTAPQTRELVAGQYVVSFSDLAGYTKPGDQTLTVGAGQTIAVAAAYTPVGQVAEKGTLSIDTDPVKGEVFVNGASWGMAPQNRQVVPGQYVVSFGDVVGHIKPGDQIFAVQAGQTIAVTAAYMPVADVAEAGTLLIDTNPVKGEVFVDGQSWGTAPRSREVAVGSHTVSFGDVEGYGKPTDLAVTVAQDQPTRVTGDYVQYALTVSVDGPGTVQTHPDRTGFKPGETVTLRAMPVAESDQFVRWGGDVDATGPEITITMDSDKTITATFQSGTCPATCLGSGVCQIGLMGLAGMLLVRPSRRRTQGNS